MRRIGILRCLVFCFFDGSVVVASSVSECLKCCFSCVWRIGIGLLFMRRILCVVVMLHVWEKNSIEMVVVDDGTRLEKEEEGNECVNV